jgi:hypothetical protein
VVVPVEVSAVRARLAALAGARAARSSTAGPSRVTGFGSAPAAWGVSRSKPAVARLRVTISTGLAGTVLVVRTRTSSGFLRSVRRGVPVRLNGNKGALVSPVTRMAP